MYRFSLNHLRDLHTENKEPHDTWRTAEVTNNLPEEERSLPVMHNLRNTCVTNLDVNRS